MPQLRIKMAGVEALRNRLLLADRRATARSFAREARYAFEVANRQIVPVDTGFLRRSFKVIVTQNRITLRWNAPYASYVISERARWPQHRYKAERIARRGAEALVARIRYRVGGGRVPNLRPPRETIL